MFFGPGSPRGRSRLRGGRKIQKMLCLPAEQPPRQPCRGITTQEVLFPMIAYPVRKGKKGLMPNGLQALRETGLPMERGRKERGDPLRR